MTRLVQLSPQAEPWGDFYCGDPRITTKLVREAARAEHGAQALYGIIDGARVLAAMTVRVGHLSAPNDVLAQLGHGDIEVPTLHIEVLAVRREAQGQGFGTALLDSAVNLGREIRQRVGLTTVSLEATAQSKAFYEGLGLIAAGAAWPDGSWAMWIALD